MRVGMRVGAGVWRFAATAIALLVVPAWVHDVAVSGAGSSCAADGPSYQVRSGDGWFAIADRAEVDVSSLLDANSAAADDALHPGDQLCLPASANLTAVCPATATVRSGDGWSAIAERAGVPLSSVLAANGTTDDRTLHPGETVCLPQGSSAERSRSEPSGDYTVVRGDSWFGIAERVGTTVGELLSVNGADSDEPLYPGQEIRLPAGATTRLAGPSSGSSRPTLQALPTQGPCWYSDSWGHGRPGGRRHEGVDIFTVAREYVYAVADGRLTLRKWAQPGNISGNAWRLTADDGTAYFYAHLFDFAPEVRVGSRVEAGQIIGWVGATGNTTADHLHFEIRPGGGRPVNPYPILGAHGGACNRGTPYTQPGGWVPD